MRLSGGGSCTATAATIPLHETPPRLPTAAIRSPDCCRFSATGAGRERQRLCSTGVPVDAAAKDTAAAWGVARLSPLNRGQESLRCGAFATGGLWGRMGAFTGKGEPWCIRSFPAPRGFSQTVLQPYADNGVCIKSLLQKKVCQTVLALLWSFIRPFSPHPIPAFPFRFDKRGGNCGS